MLAWSYIPLWCLLMYILRASIQGCKWEELVGFFPVYLISSFFFVSLRSSRLYRSILIPFGTKTHLTGMGRIEREKMSKGGCSVRSFPAAAELTSRKRRWRWSWRPGGGGPRILEKREDNPARRNWSRFGTRAQIEVAALEEKHDGSAGGGGGD